MSVKKAVTINRKDLESALENHTLNKFDVKVAVKKGGMRKLSVKLGDKFNYNGITWEVIQTSVTESKAKAITKWVEGKEILIDNKIIERNKIGEKDISVRKIEKRNPRIAAEITKVLEEIIEPEPPKDCKYPEIWYHARERVRETGEPVTKGEVKKVFDDLVKPLDKTAEVDTTKPWGVFLSGGLLGEQRGVFDSRYGKLVGSFDTKNSAELIAASRNSSLSPGEKSYYKVKSIEKEKLVHRGSKEAYLTPPSWVKQPDVWNNVMRMLEIKGPVDYGAAVAYYKNKCKKMNLVAELSPRELAKKAK